MSRSSLDIPTAPTRVPMFNLELIIGRLLICVFVATVIVVTLLHLFLDKIQPPPSRSFLIDGPHCKVPEFEPTSLKELKIKRSKLQPCKSPRLLSSVTSTNRVEDPLFVKFQPEYLGDYGVSSAICCFRAVQRKSDDESVELSAVCHEFEVTQQLDKNIEHIYVECRSDGKVVYSTVHAIITQQKAFVKRQSAAKIKKKKAYKVLMVGFDNMSRTNFIRGMPNTNKLLQNKTEWIEMKGYTRVSHDFASFNLSFHQFILSARQRHFRQLVCRSHRSKFKRKIRKM